MDRLDLSTLNRVPPEFRPALDPAARRVGIVHLGIGAFHRAHQAQYTDEAGDWGICGVTQRSPSVRDTLAPQDGLYTVLTRGADGLGAHVVGSVREVLFAGAEPDAVTARIADPDVRVVTLTVTEKGYHDGVVGRLVDALDTRRKADAGPLAVLSCDNLAHNGATLSGLVHDAASEPLLDWLAESVRFPSSMVDRIVPAATDADRADAQRLIGLRDDAAVATEPFRQWVIEDDFPGGRPDWEHAGAQFTDDVRPYELLKLRLLNAAHSTLAYLGLLAGCPTIAAAVARFEPAVTALWAETLPTLTPPVGFDVARYQTDLLARFANPALPHSTAQVAMDGSQKLPQRLLPTIREVRAAGAEPAAAALGVAAWMRWVQVAPDLDDPRADELRRAATGPAPVERLLALVAPDLADDAVVCALLADAVHELEDQQ